MKVRTVRLLDDAAADLKIARDFYDAHGEAVGNYFFESILNDLGELGLYAGIHSVRHKWHRLLSRRFPYAIYYDYDEAEVRVVAILDMRRSPKWVSSSLIARRRSKK
jgi:plasmid stabilization system protein ParE